MASRSDARAGVEVFDGSESLHRLPADSIRHRRAQAGVLRCSMGAAQGARMIAVEPRFRTAVLCTGGLYDDELPEIDAFNFAPSVHIPLVMLNGRDDFIFR